MHNKVLLLDLDSGILNLADEVMYHGYSDLYICTEVKSMPEQIKSIQPDLIIWDWSDMSRAAMDIYRSIKTQAIFTHIPILVVSLFADKLLNSDADNPDIVMLTPSADDLTAKIEHLLAS